MTPETGRSANLSASEQEAAAAVVRVRFVGGPTVVLELGGLRLLTDPTFSPAGVHESVPGRPLTKTEGPAFAANALGALDAVLLSHDQHADNLDPEGRAVVAAAALTLTTTEGAKRLGGTAIGLEAWQQFEMLRPGAGSVIVTAVPALHGPPGCEPTTGEVIGFLLRGEGLPSIYVSGDNASLEVVEGIAAEAGEIGLAILFAGAARTSLFNGSPLTLTSEDAAIAARVLAARWVIPVHIRGWAHLTEGPDDFQRAFVGAGLVDRLLQLAPGQETTVTL